MTKIKIQYRTLSSLNRWPRNPKDHDIGALKISLDRFGFVMPILVDETTERLVAGHGRLEALVQLRDEGQKPPDRIQVDKAGEWLVPVIAGLSFDSEAEAESYLLADNRLVELGGWNDEALVAILKDLQDGGHMGGTGFDDEDLEDLLARLERDGDPTDVPKPDVSAPEKLQKKWKVRPGDRWLIGDHVLMCGDSTDPDTVRRLFGSEQARLMVADAPYGVDYVGKTADAMQIENDAMSPEDLQEFLVAFLRATPLRKGGAFYLFSPSGPMETVFRNALNEAKMQLRQALVWVKNDFVLGQRDYHWRHETLLYGWRTGAAHYFVDDRTQDTVIEFPRPRRSEHHPTMKPIEIVVRLIQNSSKPGWLVYDAFCGSGTTMLAANAVGRRCYAMELDPKFCAVTLERMSEVGLVPKRES